MTKDEAIAKCKENNELYGDIFGNHYVISRGKQFHDVTDDFLKNYKYFGKIHYTLKATSVKYSERLSRLLKDMILSMCKNRRQRRIMKLKFLREDIIDIFKNSQK